jgi:hypothetical protein
MVPGLLLLLFACGGKEDTGADTSGPTVDPDAPVVTSAHASYYHHTVGTERWGWTFEATVDDPQGADTIEAWVHEEQVVRVLDTSGTELAAYDLTCTGGACTGTCWEDDDGILHTQVASYVFRFIVIDVDGNVSEPYDVTGEAGT